MKNLAFIIILLSITSCTLLGKAIDEKAEKKSGNPNDRSLESEGFSLDVQILKALLTTDEVKKEKEIDNRACKEPNTHQVCTASKGCWCEKT